MAGEKILVVDESIAVQELCRTTLTNNGWRVTTASNAVAALSYPEMADVDLLIIASDLHEINGVQATRSVRQDPELSEKPVLLLVPEDEVERESQNLNGANGYLLKPFEPGLLVGKVKALLEEKQVLASAREHLRTAAEAWMKRLAETHVQEAVEQRTQIIIERALQNIVSQVDQKTRREVDSRVTALTAEKEQELVKMTVHEVARSMVEKLAERKVTEAMEGILRDETEKAVRRVAESLLPAMTRERVRESVEQILPKEAQRRVQKEAENLVPEASEKVVLVIENAAQKLVPKIARELISEQVEKQTHEAILNSLPKHVQAMVGTELDAQMRTKVAPLVKDSADAINRRVRRTTAMMVLLLAVGLVGAFMLVAFAPDSGISKLWSSGKAPAGEVETPAVTAPPVPPTNPSLLPASWLNRLKTNNGTATRP
ncbi:hypothetical protein CVU37_10155 [candidate division BRC1 bacterium HGW-BRC1-1]|jgi:DNA-binding response OmpR family regulator|nr:MAG: hypothetical protein CVU37_10155 [candidate division BRC1 bacterium HGW-BRC1-1]